LNSSDNQGVRYILSTWLLEQDDLAAVQSVLDQFPDDVGAHVLWNRVLLLFKRGERDAAAAAARAAEKRNRLVRGYLLGVVQASPHGPAHIVASGDSEAAEYAREAMQAWRNSPGAIEWLATV